MPNPEKEQLNEEPWERFALGHKKGKSSEKVPKTCKKYDFFSRELIVYESKSLVFESDSLESQANES